MLVYYSVCTPKDEMRFWFEFILSISYEVDLYQYTLLYQVFIMSKQHSSKKRGVRFPAN